MFKRLIIDLHYRAYIIVYGVRENTAKLFMHKIREVMKSSENLPMEGI